MRYECLQLARKHQAAYIQLYIQCPLDIASQRNAVRPEHQRVPESVMRRMAKLFEEPNAVEHSWEAHTIVLDGSIVYSNRYNTPICQLSVQRPCNL